MSNFLAKIIGKRTHLLVAAFCFLVMFTGVDGGIDLEVTASKIRQVLPVLMLSFFKEGIQNVIKATNGK